MCICKCTLQTKHKIRYCYYNNNSVYYKPYYYNVLLGMNKQMGGKLAIRSFEHFHLFYFSTCEMQNSRVIIVMPISMILTFAMKRNKII